MSQNLAAARYINLESFRKSGVGVRTPVWFVASPDGTLLYVYSTADAGKTKRIRRNGRVLVAPCDMRGKLTGAWCEATAEIVAGPEFDAGMKLLVRKYWPWKTLMDLATKWFGRHERVMFRIRPSGPGA